MTAVANAGPLIALAQIGQFNLLRLLYKELCLPPAVRDEVVIVGQLRPGAVEVETADWIRIINVRDQTAVELLRESPRIMI